MSREIKFRAWSMNKMVYFGLYSVYGDESMPVMQSTGLKDKNGVEIYDGDIILEDDIFKHIIRYGKGTFDTGTYTYIGFYLEKNDEQSEHTWFTEQLDRFEVIGNIYENPELLENK